MKRYLSVLIVFVLLLSMLTGCGAASKDTAAMEAPQAAPEAAPMAPMEEAVMEEVLYDEAASETGSAGTALPENQKLIRTVYMDAETLDLTPLMSWIESRVASLGGYFEQKSVRRSGSRDDGSYYQYADLMIRIPAQNLDQFTAQVGEKINVTSTSETTENVTLQYVSTKSRVEALETEQKRLLELLEEAGNMEDLLTIESRLTDVRYELENISSQLRVYDNKVNYGTIHLSITEVVEYSEPEPENGWQRMANGFIKSVKGVGNGLKEFFIWLVTAVPYLLLIGAIGFGIFLIIFCSVRRKQKRRAAQKKAEE